MLDLKTRTEHYCPLPRQIVKVTIVISKMLHRRCRLWMDCLKNCVIIIPAKLCNQRKNFSHDVELNIKGILHYTWEVT